MCFSAAGSFAVGGVLLGVGAVSISRNSSDEHRMFAAIPLIFASQQVAEGVVWLTMGDLAHAGLHRLTVSVFLAIAMVLWPMWMPYSLRQIERNPGRRRILSGLSWFGVLVALSSSILMTIWRPVAAISGHSISYNYVGSDDVPRHILMVASYVVPTVLPLFVSTAQLARTIGATLVVSLMVAVVVERDALTSVWCFFAAILSVLVTMAVVREQELNLTASAAIVPSARS